METQIDILNLSGDYVKNKEKYEFSLLNSPTRIKVDKVYKIIDPSADQAFKILFNGNIVIENINGLERAKSLIKSLLYKFKNGEIIKNLEYLPNELPEMSGKNREKLKILNCPFLCKMNDDSQYIVDLKMQNYYFEGLDLNSLGYGTYLHKYFSLPVIIIVLLMKDSDGNNSFGIKPAKIYLNETVFKPIDDYVYVLCLDLFYILDCINNNEEPELDGLSISREGKEWIKFLTVKDWMKKLNRSEKNIRYLIPQNLNNSKELISALIILNSNDNSKLIKTVLEEKKNQIISKDIENKTVIKIWINSFLKKKLLDESIIPFPDVAPEYLIKLCKENISNKNICLEFLDTLIKKGILKMKKIYKTLIDKYYN